MTITKRLTKFGARIRADGLGAFRLPWNMLISRIREPYTNAILRTAESLLAPVRRHETLTDPLHAIYRDFAARVNEKGDARVLEIGARDVTGVTRRDNFAGCAEYVGFDVLAGPNVDVVGDVHEISRLFSPAYFDGVTAVAVFEHLAMPWKAIVEINQVMKEGGLLFLLTHPAWPPHELPWDFWRFNKEAFKVMLNRNTGFEILSCHEGGPGRIVSLSTEAVTRQNRRVDINQFIVVLARKIGLPAGNLAWGGSTAEFIETMYPAASADGC